MKSKSVYKYSYSFGPEYPTDCTMILTNNFLGVSNEYSIESAPWAILSAFAFIDERAGGGATYSIPDLVGDFIWFGGDDDLIEN